MTDDKKVRLSGVSIGLALNSVSYSRSGRETKIPDDELEREGMKMADEVVRRLRARDGFEDVPICRRSIQAGKKEFHHSGHLFCDSISGKGKAAPVRLERSEMSNTSCTLLHPRWTITGILIRCSNILSRISMTISRVSSMSSVKGFIKDNRMQSIAFEVPIQFFGTSETIGFTQYLTGLIVKYFPNTYTEVSITSANGPEALIVKRTGKR